MSYYVVRDGTVTVRCGTEAYGNLLAWAVINRKVFWYGNDTFTVRM